MQTIELANGRQAKCSVQYGNEKPTLQRPSVRPGQKAKRKDFKSVRVAITVTENGDTVKEFVGTSYCSPVDDWDRIKGRRLALKRAIETDNGDAKVLTKTDRAAIAERLLPWFFGKETPPAEAGAAS